MNFICKGKNSKLKISNLFTHKVLIYLQKIRFLFTFKINSKNKTFLDFIKRILIDFKFIKEKSSIWSSIYKEMILVYTLLKKQDSTIIKKH